MIYALRTLLKSLIVVIGFMSVAKKRLTNEAEKNYSGNFFFYPKVFFISPEKKLDKNLN